MKNLVATGLASAFLLTAFHCAQLPTGDGSGSHTGNPGLVGHLVDGRTGSPADSAMVHIYPMYLNKIAQTLGKTATGVPAIDSTLSDSSGYYRFDSVADGFYSIEAKKIDAGDTLYMRHTSVLFMENKDVGWDTLRLPGSIRGKIVVPTGESAKNITCYIPGTSYIAITNDTGGFRITGIPAGTYSLSITSTRFNDTTIYGFKVTSNHETNAGYIALGLDRSKNEHDVWGMFDTTYNCTAIDSIVARVSGDSIPPDSPRVYTLDWRPALNGYSGFIYVPDNGFFWIVDIWVFDAQGRRIGAYRVPTINRATGDVQVPDFNPFNSIPVITLHDTTVSINDTVRLNPAITKLADDSIISMEWKIGAAGTFAAVTNKDTILVAPINPCTIVNVFRVTDKFGNMVVDTVVDSVIIDAPVFNSKTGPDTILPVDSTMMFIANVSHRFGRIAMYKWDYQGDGVWDDSGNTMDSALHTYTSTGANKVVCQARDDDGNVITSDTVNVTVATVISGVINRNTTLMESGSPYLVKEYITVQYGSTMTIDPGVTIMGPINIYGRLIAEGTSTKRIKWASPFWIRISTYAVCDFKYCDMMEGGVISTAVEFADTVILDSCRCYNVVVYLRQNYLGLIRGCMLSADSASVYLAGGNCLVYDNTIDIPAYVCGADCPGLKVQGPNSIISSNRISGGCIIWKSGSGGTISSNTVSGGGYIWCDSTDSVTDNTVQNAFSSGIQCGSCRTVDHNLVENCMGTGISGTGPAQVICNNTVSDNRFFGIYTEGDNCTIRHNTVTGSGLYSDPWVAPCFYAGVVCMNALCTIDSNLITANVNGAIGRNGSRVVNNNIHDNRDYDFRVMCVDSSDVDVSNNWWGTSDTAQIQLKIYDDNDDPRYGRALIDPVAIDSIPGAGPK